VSFAATFTAAASVVGGSLRYTRLHSTADVHTLPPTVDHAADSANEVYEEEDLDLGNMGMWTHQKQQQDQDQQQQHEQEQQQEQHSQQRKTKSISNRSKGKKSGYYHILNATLGGAEIMCLNCQQPLFEAWLHQIAAHGCNTASAPTEGYAGGKHPNSPCYDKWNDANKKKESTSLLADPTTPCENASSIVMGSFSTWDIESLKPRLAHLWAQRRLIIGAGGNPLHQPMDFVQALVSLARNAPEMLPKDECGTTPLPVDCDVFLSGMQPVATRSQLRLSLDQTFGAEFLQAREFEENLDADEQKSRVKSLLAALKHSFLFYHQTCLAHEDGAEKCEKKAVSQIVGQIACKPEDDEPSDDCVYAEVRHCGACGNESRLFEYSRFHGPLALIGTGPSRDWVMGQCGEFSRMGYALLASTGWKARYVLDFTDHVWIEVLLKQKDGSSKWIHADPSEGVLDAPLMYEKGWGKKLTMIFAFTPWSVEHVTETYTEDYNGTLARRVISESRLQMVLREANRRLRSELPLHKWGYAAPQRSKDRTLEDVFLWSHFEA